MDLYEAYTSGDFRSFMNALGSQDHLQESVPCPCGHVNTVIVVRTGRVITMWTDAASVHGSQDDNGLDVMAYESEAVAIQLMERHRAHVAQLLGMAQFAAAVTGNPQAVPGDFMVI